MLKGKAQIGAQSMPTSEDLAKWGAYELSFEELLEVNGGKRDRSGGRSGGGRSSRSSGSGGSSSKGSSGRGSNKSSGGGVKSKETNKDKRKGSKTHTGSTGREGKKNGGLSGNGLKGGEPKSKEEKKSGSTDYTVRKGDTLSGIVRERYPGASKEEIAEKVKEVAKNSGIKDIDVIHPGDKIIFEKATEPSSEAGSAEANTGKEKGSAERTSREGRGSTGNGFLRGGGYRQGEGRKTIGEQALLEHKGLSGIQQKENGLPQATNPTAGAVSKEKTGLRNFFNKTKNTVSGTIEDLYKKMEEVKDNTLQAVQHVLKEATKWHYEIRDVKNQNLPSYDEAIKSKEVWRLDDEWMSQYHQNGIGSPELKFVNKDGREAVYTKDFSSDGSYELYTDSRYKGTYNYVTSSAPPSTPDSITDFRGIADFITGGTKFLATGTGHFLCDMLPYFVLGNER